MTRTKFGKWDAGGIALGLLIGLVYFGPDMFEPRDDLRYEDATVVSYHPGRRGSGAFTVRSNNSGRLWEVREIRGDFPHTYQGAAVLGISRGRWTGHTHVRLLNHRPAEKT